MKKKKTRKLPIAIPVHTAPFQLLLNQEILLEENFIQTINSLALRLTAEKLKDGDWCVACKLPQDDDLDESAGICRELEDAVKAAICVRILRATNGDTFEAKRIAEEQRRRN